MSSMTAVENICDNIPLAILPVKQEIITKSIPVIEELEIDLGDMEYRNRNNFMKGHKIKMLDVFLEMKQKKDYKQDYKHSGKIYKNYPKGTTTHSLYMYFKKGINEYSVSGNRFKWTEKPTKFAELLKRSIIEMVRCEYSMLNQDDRGLNIEIKDTCKRLIDEWLEKPNYQGEWDLVPLFGEFRDTFIYKKQLWTRKNPPERTDEPALKWVKDEETGKKVLCKESDKARQKWIRENEIKREAQDNENLKKYMIMDFTKIFTPDRKCRKFNSPELLEYIDLYKCSIKRTWNGKGMDYDKSPIHKYHMSRWKYTTPNGGCSNKSLKATHMYWNNCPQENWNGRKCGWTFEAVKQIDAEELAKMNGFPLWGKKGNGNPKPTYRDLKNWWLKLE